MKMSLCFLLLGLTSCTSSITYNRLTDRPEEIPIHGILFLNAWDVPVSKKMNTKLTTTTFKYLNEIWSDTVTYVDTTYPLGILQNPIPYTLDSFLLDSLRKYTPYRYLIHISADMSNHSGGLGFNFSSSGPLGIDFDNDNYATVGIIIFDIEKQIRVYDQAIRGTESISETNTNAFLFTKSTENILKNTWTRSLNKLKQHVRKMQRHAKHIPYSS